MAYSILGVLGPPPFPAAVEQDLSLKAAERGTPSFKVRCDADTKQRPPKAIAITRRDALVCLTGISLAGFTLSWPDTAEARTVKPETRKKIREKLDKLREKSRSSKPKDNNNEKEPRLQPPSSKKENKVPLEPPPLPLPSPS
ncbi:hypothetical protein Ancab_018441 [Ancistrocladus abbreviatus]